MSEILSNPAEGNDRFPGAVTVTQLNEFVKSLIDNSDYLSSLYVKGEAYTVIFQNDDGTVLSTAEYFAGETVVVPEVLRKYLGGLEIITK